jgi:hypothetical protein
MNASSDPIQDFLGRTVLEFPVDALVSYNSFTYATSPSSTLDVLVWGSPFTTVAIHLPRQVNE